MAEPLPAPAPASVPAPRRRLRLRRTLVVAAALLAVLVAAALWQRAHPLVIATSVDIEAAPGDVWAVLTDFESYPGWNSALVGMSGDLEQGSTLTFAADGSADAMTFAPVVREVREPEHLRWEGSVVVVGLLDGEHAFDLEPLPDGGTRLHQTEHFRGIAVPFLAGWLREDTTATFVAMNEALRDRVEARP